ncbi:MAG: hypothetical protein AB2809_12060 [Candidatus Thiodiazotropha sp.]
MQYRTSKALRENTPDQEQQPFLKRIVLEHENDFRLFLSTDKSLSEAFRIKMPLISVDRITLSPWQRRENPQSDRRLLKNKNIQIDTCQKGEMEEICYKQC